jgi:hypothetical protein
MTKVISTTFLIFCAGILSAQKSKPINTDALAEKHAVASFKEFYELLSIPNDAHHPEDIEKNVVWCEAAFSKRGFTT